METGPVEVDAVAQAPPTRLAFNTEESGFTHPDSHQGWPDIEKQMILEALVKASGRKNKAAVSLGWARSTLWRKMKQHGIR
jgi:transcriptional regulator of acetoin/glycerol metabolism